MVRYVRRDAGCGMRDATGFSLDGLSSADGSASPIPPPASRSLRRLRDLAEYDVRYAVLGTPGVLKVTTMGGEQRQYEVAVDPTRLAASGFTLDEVVRAVASANVSFSGGFIAEGAEEYFVRGVGRIDRLADLRKVSLGTHNGVPVLLEQVADVRIGSASRRGI